MARPILIADTCETTRDLLKKTLTDHYPLIIVESPAQAIKVIREKHVPILVLMGVNESLGKEGENLFAAARESAPDTVIIALGDRTAENTAVEAVRAGATGYMIKPLNPHDITAIADKHAKILT